MMPTLAQLCTISILPVARWRRFAAFLADDHGQDLVEYALLAAFIGIAGWAILLTIPNTMATAYTNWQSPTTGVPSLWQPPEPTGGGS